MALALVPHDPADPADARPVALYCRISHDPANLREGVDRQEADCRAIASTRWPGAPTALYTDNDASALRARPEYQRLLADIQAGTVRAVVVWNQDRLVRRPMELEQLIDLCERVPSFDGLATAHGDLDLTHEGGRLVARMLVAVAGHEGEAKGRRVRRAAAERRAKGHKISGKNPYGVASWVGGDVTVDPAQAAVIREVARRVVEGRSLRSSVAWARDADPAAPRSQAGWRHLLLRSPVLEGRLARDVWAVLSADGRWVGNPGTRTCWLTGLLLCGVCGKAMYCNAREYRCPGHVTARRVPVEGEVAGRVIASVVEQQEPAAGTPPDPAGDRRAALKALMQRLVDGDITEDEWQVLRAEETALPPAPRPQPRAPEPVADLTLERWTAMDVIERHNAARAVLVSVRVKPAEQAASRFDPGRLVYEER